MLCRQWIPSNFGTDLLDSSALCTAIFDSVLRICFRWVMPNTTLWRTDSTSSFCYYEPSNNTNRNQADLKGNMLWSWYRFGSQNSCKLCFDWGDREKTRWDSHWTFREISMNVFESSCFNFHIFITSTRSQAEAGRCAIQKNQKIWCATWCLNAQSELVKNAYYPRTSESRKVPPLSSSDIWQFLQCNSKSWESMERRVAMIFLKNFRSVRLKHFYASWQVLEENLFKPRACSIPEKLLSRMWAWIVLQQGFCMVIKDSLNILKIQLD